MPLFLSSLMRTFTPEVPDTFHWFCRRYFSYDRSSFQPIGGENSCCGAQQGQSWSSMGVVMSEQKDTEAFWQIKPAASSDDEFIISNEWRYFVCVEIF